MHEWNELRVFNILSTAGARATNTRYCQSRSLCSACIEWLRFSLAISFSQSLSRLLARSLSGSLDGGSFTIAQFELEFACHPRILSAARQPASQPVGEPLASAPTPSQPIPFSPAQDTTRRIQDATGANAKKESSHACFSKRRVITESNPSLRNPHLTTHGKDAGAVTLARLLQLQSCVVEPLRVATACRLQSKSMMGSTKTMNPENVTNKLTSSNDRNLLYYACIRQTPGGPAKLLCCNLSRLSAALRIKCVQVDSGN